MPAELAGAAEARPFIKSVEALKCSDEGGPVRAAGVRVMLDRPAGVSDVILTAGDADKVRDFTGAGMTLRLLGRFAHVRFQGTEPIAVHLVGAKRLEVGGKVFECEAAELAGTVRQVDERQAVVETDQKLPTDGRLNGQVILFSNSRYGRNTAHRIARVEALANGSRIVLESPSLVLGTGLLEDDPPNEHEFASLVVHEYARSDSKTGTQFFSGKLIKGKGFATNIVRTDCGQLMKYTVETTKGMGAGAKFVICDVQAGDTFTVPMTKYVKG